jgi:hypothetical protein
LPSSDARYKHQAVIEQYGAQANPISVNAFRIARTFSTYNT